MLANILHFFAGDSHSISMPQAKLRIDQQPYLEIGLLGQIGPSLLRFFRMFSLGAPNFKNP